MAKQWIISPAWPHCAEAAARWNVPPLVAQILHQRGLEVHDSVSEFLAPQLTQLYPPRSVPGAAAAAQRITGAIADRRRIVLYGDYDVDGITGVAILWHLLRAAGADVSFYVPHRLEEGYGLNRDALAALARDGASLVITVDCGITAVDEATHARALGLELIITDHHQYGGDMPDALCVHPAIGEGSANGDLCGAGVAFKLAWAVAQELTGAEKVAPRYRDCLIEALPLAALGTIADVVPLIGENRIIARHGLAAIAHARNVGLAALVDATGIDRVGVKGDDVGFKLAPRLNAAGRLGHARLAVELLTRADEARAREIALYLEEHNRARQTVERRIIRQAHEMVQRQGMDSDACRGIVLAEHGWHAGVIGIVAARLVDRYHRPTVLISLDNDTGRGSGRSVPHFDMYAALSACAAHLESFGGHAMAGGLRIRPAAVERFAQAFVAHANRTLTGADLRPKLRLDGETALASLCPETVQAILNLGPFGVGNPRPKLATGWVELADEPRRVGRNADHLQAAFTQNGTMVKAIAFGQGGQEQALKRHRRCRLAFEPILNDFNGRRTAEMQVHDFDFAK